MQMKAVLQNHYGDSRDLQVGQVEKPRPGPDEVLVEVKAASVHPDVWHVVAGRPYVLRLMGAGVLRPTCKIPGTDFAGIVREVGNKVVDFKPDDRVFGESIRGMQWVNGGTFAQFVAASSEGLAKIPADIPFEVAAAVPTAGLIVLLNLAQVDPLPKNANVLVNGAAGGVGSIALQVLKARGAHITAVDHHDRLDALRELGADVVVDYTQHDFTQGDARYDLIFDIPGNHPYASCQRVLAPAGKYILIGHENFGKQGRRAFGLLPKFFGLMFRALRDPQLARATMKGPPKRESMRLLADLLAQGKLRPQIGATYPLEQIVQAMEHLESGNSRGKILLTM